ncbi:MAG: hypothetical protein Q7V57_14195 [Actinomycetota bacterium]|nr:hypothetical protein [Actinomycetota bacterium]
MIFGYVTLPWLPLGAASSAVRGCMARRRDTDVPMHMAILAADAATTWSAISAIASAVAAIAAVYVARRLGTLQVEITAYTVVRDEVDAFESDLMRSYRRMVCTSYVAADELDEDAQQVILGALERVAEGVRSKIISLRRLWTSELGDLLTLYVVVCKDQIAVERTNSPTFLEGILWCDRKLRRYTFVREASSRVKRLRRRALFTKRHVVPDREITRLAKIEAALIPRP